MSASRPVEAVTLFGDDIENAGSMIASDGIRQSPFRSIFMLVALSVITVNFVASEPVPAVVGIAAIGGIFPFITFPI